MTKNLKLQIYLLVVLLKRNSSTSKTLKFSTVTHNSILLSINFFLIILTTNAETSFSPDFRFETNHLVFTVVSSN